MTSSIPIVFVAHWTDNNTAYDQRSSIDYWHLTVSDKTRVHYIPIRAYITCANQFKHSLENILLGTLTFVNDHIWNDTFVNVLMLVQENHF